MRRVHLKTILRLSLLLAGSLLAGCAETPEDRDFFYHGWSAPKNTADDHAYFYGGKTRPSGDYEDPKLPSGQRPE